VDTVSWDDAQSFLAKLNERDKRAGWMYRLPKEAEWEYACRGGPMTDKADSAFAYYFDKPTNQLLPEQANFYHPNGLKQTCKVGSYPPNPLGLYDMHGNVWEWCDDAQTNRASLRIMRGGSWTAMSEGCSAANRPDRPPPARHHDGGLRVARVPVAKVDE
jgi:formylglycine-generating enzyme required for sulfatase activity